ncbi:MAG TPA: esterase-like activity of phytase family protein [Xanthobacteraceae bacterium]|nr:esterase-like activity of phytase family protein [Xanthobacteraceae bacterium]
MNDRTRRWRCGLAGPSQRTITAVIASAWLIGAMPAAAQTSPSAASPHAIEIQAEPITGFDIRDPSRRQFGLLEFRGGLVLRSPEKHFGGLSAIRVAADGAHFLSLTDRGWWFRGRLLYAGTRPSGIADAEMAPILGADGRPLAARGWYDTEAIAEDGGTLYVGIERVHQIVRFNYGKDGLLARGRAIALPPEMRALPADKGIEALVFVPKGLPLAGTLIAISERGLDTAGNLSAFLIGGATPGAFAIKRDSRYDVTDAALLPGGNMLLLERRFGWDTGLAVRIRRIALGEIKPGALADGAVLFEADLGYEIDNMEGLSVHRAAGGELVLTLVSDDNFSVVQRTLLLQFTLAEP